MKRRKSLFVHFSHIRLLAKKFAIVLLFLVAFVMMMINKTDTVIIEKTSSVATDVISPLIDVLSIPSKVASAIYDYFRDWKNLYADNQTLREENEILKEMHMQSRKIEIENRLLADLLNYIIPPEAKFKTVRVIAEEGDAFSHSLIAYTGPNSDIKKGQIAISDKGVVGRIENIGNIYSKIILISDINSKIPVMIERSRARGILSGDNTPLPKLVFTSADADISVGDIVVTSGVAGVFPPGLPIGKVVSASKNNIRVKSFSSLDQLEYLKIVDYDLDGLIEQDAGVE